MPHMEIRAANCEISMIMVDKLMKIAKNRILKELLIIIIGILQIQWAVLNLRISEFERMACEFILLSVVPLCIWFKFVCP